MSKKKRIAFVYSRTGLDSAKLLYMPFGINSVIKLADGDVLIDLYVSQKHTEDYKKDLPDNVNIIFLENKNVWNFGAGKGLYYLLNFYFYCLTFYKKYDFVWGIGQVGTVLGGKLAKRKKTPFFYLSDEFPNTSYLKIWRNNEKKYAGTAQFFIVPDESRLAVTQQQVPALKKIRGYTLPNIPLQNNAKDFDVIDWNSELGLPSSKKLIMYAGGIDRENNIDLLLTIFPFTNEEFILVMVGNGKNYKNNMFFKHDRIIWIESVLPEAKLHSLIKQSICNICFYSDILDLEFVGKSSGKIMRSLLMGTPVIATKFNSLQFIEDDKMGILVTHPYEIIEGINILNKNSQYYKDNISKNIEKYYFEKYWQKLPLTK